jgi:hypothetical protein
MRRYDVTPRTKAEEVVHASCRTETCNPPVRGSKDVRAAASLVRKLYQPALDELAK